MGRESCRRQPEPTGIEGAAGVFAMAAFLNVGLALGLPIGGWLTQPQASPFALLGLELAGVAVTVSAVALALGPTRGPAARQAWLAGASALALVGCGILWLLPALIGPEL